MTKFQTGTCKSLVMLSLLDAEPGKGL